jgi:transposase
MTCGALTALSSEPAELPPERGKKIGNSRRLGGRKETQLQEPPDHALGRSWGGFGTKVHLVCDSHGFILAIHLTAGQAHESKAFEPTMARPLFHRRRGTGRWPHRLAGDKGYSYPRIRRWCCRRRIEAVIPTRSNQQRNERFDKRRYRKRNIMERSIGRHKEYRSLGTRYEKLAVNYLALWLVAIIERALKRLFPNRA